MLQTFPVAILRLQCEQCIVLTLTLTLAPVPDRETQETPYANRATSRAGDWHLTLSPETQETPSTFTKWTVRIVVDLG
jgi:hypothetical protein